MGSFISLPILQALGPLVTPLLGTLLSPGEASSVAPPSIPAPAEVPEVPEVSKAEDISDVSTPALDIEATRIRAAKRRKASVERSLFSLEEEDGIVVLNKTLLGG